MRSGSDRGALLPVLVAAAALALGAVGVLLLHVAAGSLVAAAAPTGRLDDAVAAGAAAAGGLLAAAWALGGLLVALGRLAPAASATGVLLQHLGARLLPAVLRGVLVAALGAAPLVAAGPASAATVPPAATQVEQHGESAVPTDLPVTTRTTPEGLTVTGGPAPAAPTAEPASSSGTDLASAGTTTVAVPDVAWRPPSPPPLRDAATAEAEALVVPAPRADAAEGGRQVVVVRGDTLWDIAARALPPGADDAEVAAAWPAWYETNRHVIGDDPDLLRPGQVLLVPTSQVTR
ncbi:LysM peptidoglycan-binding domain-containing protein [Pseudokineococcus sp. 1T1Z-3]|uniref:LysM peptidoglycan-binding domain-containing protein n=1 Tax=Pseudokineococcus sp. 1T1Z-3 TaxID=3132745 RepID=UPI0030AEB7AB